MIERQQISLSQFADLLAIEPERFLGVEVNRLKSTVTLILEGDGRPEGSAIARGLADETTRTLKELAMQTTGTCPPLSDNVKRKPRKKGR